MVVVIHEVVKVALAEVARGLVQLVQLRVLLEILKTNNLFLNIDLFVSISIYFYVGNHQVLSQVRFLSQLRALSETMLEMVPVHSTRIL